jgi:hypothetical protein
LPRLKLVPVEAGIRGPSEMVGFFYGLP